jgi:hypothetical protein
LEFIEKIVGHVAWPLATIGILLIAHRVSILTALKSLKVAPTGGLELQFREAREQAEVAKLPVAEATLTADDQQGKFLRMAEDFPQAAIMQKWIELEKEIVELATNYAQTRIAPSARPMLLRDALQDLRIHEVLDPATQEVIERLRRIRNDVVHARKEAVTPGEALEFRELANAVVDQLRQSKSLIAPERGSKDPPSASVGAVPDARRDLS